MSTSRFPSLIDEWVDELIHDHMPPSGEPLDLNPDMPIAKLPVRLSPTLQNHHWKHEVHHDQPSA